MENRVAARLLLGPEEGEKTAYMDTIVQDIARQRGSPPDVLRFYPTDGNLPAFLDGLQTGDLFASHRVAVIADVEQLGKSDVERLARFLASPAPEVTLFLLSSSPSLSPRDAAHRLTKLVPESGRKVFWELFAGQKMGWLMRFFGTKGLRIDRVAAEYLLDVVESNTRDLKAECEKLALFQGAGAVVSQETVEQFVYHSKEENAFTLFDRVAERALEPSLEVLHKILLSPPFEGIAVLGGLLVQFRRLLDLKLLMLEGLDFEGAVAKAGIRGKRNQQSFRVAHRNYSLEDVRSIIALSSDEEASLRSLRSDLQNLELSLYLFRVVARGGGAHARAPKRPSPETSR